MKVSALKGYVLVVFSGLVILLLASLVGMQWSKTGVFSLYGKDVQARMWLVMLLSAAGGFLLLGMLRLLKRGVRALRKGGVLPDSQEQDEPAP